MSQLSLYLDDNAMETLRRDAAREGVSLSRHAARLIQENGRSSWPEGFFNLYGILDDDLFAEPSELPWKSDGYTFDDFAEQNGDSPCIC